MTKTHDAFAGYRISEHALQRMREMSLSREEVMSALEDARISYPGSTDSEPGRVVVIGGRLAVVVALGAKVVVTVLWAGRSSRGEVAA